MKRKIQKIGSSASIVIPAEFMRDLKLTVGDVLDFSIVKGTIMMKPVAQPIRVKTTGSNHTHQASDSNAKSTF
ncbi:MAG: AbrB/MazE/SpoVT family DNA-binding domain-containing protein [Candidatus Methanoperedens sp.]|nr:AbrB/MazE/SpoVT family DNA-binding domain-containing protein [Candidatus Methanoperedens sp.]